MSQTDRVQRSERHKTIIRVVNSAPRSIGELAEITGTSAVTIRRDLVELAEMGAIERTRGGAGPVLARGDAYPFRLRSSENVQAKRALAERAAALVSPGQSIVLDNGTTILALAQRLSGTGVTALALSLHAAAALKEHPGDEVSVPGGPIDGHDLAFTSAGASEAVRAMRFDTAFLGACAADPANGLTSAGWGDAQVKKAAIASANRTVLVCTPDKFSRTAAYRFADLDALDTVVTTADAPADLVELLRRSGIEVLLAPLDAPED